MCHNRTHNQSKPLPPPPLRGERKLNIYRPDLLAYATVWAKRHGKPATPSSLPSYFTPYASCWRQPPPPPPSCPPQAGFFLTSSVSVATLSL